MNEVMNFFQSIPTDLKDPERRKYGVFKLFGMVAAVMVVLGILF